MMKRMRKIVSLLLSFTLVFACMCNIASAAEVTADFDIDPELWKCIVEKGMFNYDENDDGVVTKEEFGNAYGLQIDCEGYDIKDWSALQYGTEWQMVAIRNCTGCDLSSLAELTKLRTVNIMSIPDYKKIEGLDKLDNVPELYLSTDSEVDLNDFSSMNSLKKLSLSADKFSGYEGLADYENLGSLLLSGQSVVGIESIPEGLKLEEISLSFPDLDDAILNETVKKINISIGITIEGSNITGTDWLKELFKISVPELYGKKISLKNNQITDIDTLLEMMDSMTLTSSIYLGGNPLDAESRIKLIQRVIKCDTEIRDKVGKKVLLYYEADEPYVDLADYQNITIESADNSIAEVKGNYLELKAVGSTKLKFKHEDVEFEYDVVVEDADAEILSKVIGSTVEYFDTETGTLTITGSGIARSDIRNYADHIYHTKFPWLSHEVKTLIVEEGITSMSPGCFADYYENLEKVVLPSSLDELSASAFESCTSLKEISIPEGCSLGGNVFTGCTSLAEIYLPESVKYIGEDCFTDTAAWNDEDNFTDNVFYIDKIAVDFKESKYDINKEIVLRSDTVKLANNFMKGMKIRAITFPEGLESIPDEVCMGCDYLVGAFIPDSVESIGDDAFTKSKFLTIYCNEGSYAQEYAIENGIPYDTVNKDLSNAISLEEIQAIYRGENNTPTPTVTPEVILLLGDIDGDNVVNAKDALTILKHAAKLELIADDKSDVADVNEDTKIDAQDALEVLKIAAKIHVKIAKNTQKSFYPCHV